MKINPNVYKKAANLITIGGVESIHRGACIAISIVATSDEPCDLGRHCNLFNEYFNPHDEACFWFGDRSLAKNKLRRELALDLMAEIAKDLK